MVSAMLVSAFLSQAETTLLPTDDVWVYQHAFDQMNDPFLRAWGSAEKPVADMGDGFIDGSFSLLKFDLSDVEVEGDLEKATLVLVMPGPLGFGPEEAEQFPLQIRPAAPNFDEETWNYDLAPDFIPNVDDEAVFGKGHPVDNGQETMTFEIDLLAGPNDFAAHLVDLKATGTPLSLALTSMLQPVQAGDGSIYKVYGKAADQELQPKLVLSFN